MFLPTGVGEMRERIIDMLDFPRTRVRSNIEFENCTHAGNFAPGDAVCADCASRLECSWLYHNDDFSGLKEKAMPQLVKALEFALEYIEASSYRAGHRQRNAAVARCAYGLIKRARSTRRLDRPPDGVADSGTGSPPVRLRTQSLCSRSEGMDYGPRTSMRRALVSARRGNVTLRTPRL